MTTQLKHIDYNPIDLEHIGTTNATDLEHVLTEGLQNKGLGTQRTVNLTDI